MTRNVHTVEKEWQVASSAGTLSAAKQFVLDCQIAISARIAADKEHMDILGGALLESAPGVEMSNGFMASLMGCIQGARIGQEIDKPGVASQPSWMPAPLVDFIEKNEIDVNWKNLGFGISRLSLWNKGKEKLYLLKSRPGLKMPRHSHYGQEWALILQGGYHVGSNSYGYGDLHSADESSTHQPIIDDDGEDCITLVASDGGVKFANPFLRPLQPLIGI